MDDCSETVIFLVTVFILRKKIRDTKVLIVTFNWVNQLNLFFKVLVLVFVVFLGVFFSNFVLQGNHSNIKVTVILPLNKIFCIKFRNWCKHTNASRHPISRYWRMFKFSMYTWNMHGRHQLFHVQLWCGVHRDTLWSRYLILLKYANVNESWL